MKRAVTKGETKIMKDELENLCPNCGKNTSDYNDYGVDIKICKHCGWVESPIIKSDK